MENLGILTQGVKGGKAKFQNNLGMVKINADDSTTITMDNFEGFGDSYKKRSETNIKIEIEGNEIFNGNKAQLKDKLISNITDEEAIVFHHKLREILKSYGNEEFGDVIIDEISFLYGYPTTTDVEVEEEFYSVTVTDIEYCFDEAEENVHDYDLKTNMVVAVPSNLKSSEEVQVFLENYITSESGFCVNGFSFNKK